ncbi:hypothetical protein N5D61_15955 [Pseudomonas sp. GD03842]|uniref:hypothetical protein n=1 Tax=unclassified Pseudomonas TaxID=196821 RepID=UPI0011BF2E91|nr:MULTISPECIES: hypothetical protein [unclassified Pseudomonas]MDH0747831.1 hypothetical protein [Pseudomonas sp. GD03842]
MSRSNRASATARLGKIIFTVTGLCCVLSFSGCFDNDHNRDKAKDQSKPSLQMQQPDQPSSEQKR